MRFIYPLGENPLIEMLGLKRSYVAQREVRIRNSKYVGECPVGYFKSRGEGLLYRSEKIKEAFRSYPELRRRKKRPIYGFFYGWRVLLFQRRYYHRRN